MKEDTKRIPPEVLAMAKKLFDEHGGKVPGAFPWTIVAEWLGERMPGLKQSGAIWPQIRALEQRLQAHRCLLVEVPLLQWLELERVPHPRKERDNG